jgi:GntR family phosphonate transport system transcriptional regulator
MQTRRLGTAVWKQIERSIAGAIMAGEMRPGDRLPSEGRLAEQYAVNKNTVRRALAELVAQGLLRVENGVGAAAGNPILGKHPARGQGAQCR